METTPLLALNAFIERFAAGERQKLTRYLSDSDREKLLDAPPRGVDNHFRFLSCNERLERIHYSWFIPILETLSANDKHILCSIFRDAVYTKLRCELDLPEKKCRLTPLGESFVCQTLYKWFVQGQKDFIPYELIPDVPLQELLTLSKEELVTLFDYVGLHDLAVDLKRIVESNKLQAIQNALSDAKKSYIRSIIKKGEPIAFKYLELENWDGNVAHLNRMIHARGINRVSKAIFGSHPSFLWHLRHTLDKGRAQMLDYFCINSKNEKMQDMLRHQVKEAIQHILKLKREASNEVL